jgi:3-phenylpropionate/trans-cinnamate dioxygenase ferredoxin reductase subunit
MDIRDESVLSCVIVGASHAGSLVAVQLRKEGWAGRIVLIGAEPQLPYHRPPMSKSVLAGEKEPEAVLLRPQAMYADNAIELMLGQTVERIERVDKQLRLASGELIAYDRLVLCTGTYPRRLAADRGQAGLHYLRTAQDALALRHDMESARQAVIVGGGYIGLEAAAVMAQKGLQVTLLESAPQLLQRVTSRVIADYFRQLHASHGVRIVTGARVVDIEGNARVEGVRCDDGSLHPADIVLVGIGVLPATELAAKAGLQVDDGIVVDQSGCSSDPDIYAAGDCTRYPSRRYQRALRLECVQNALDQAKVVAATLCGRPQVYDALPWFWSDQYDIKLQSAGLILDYERCLLRGDSTNPGGKGFSVFYLRDGRMVAADCVNRAREFMVCKRIIAEDLPVNLDALQAEDSPLEAFIKS